MTRHDVSLSLVLKLLFGLIASVDRAGVLSIVIILSFATSAFAQGNPIGILPFSSMDGGMPDSINNANLNTHLTIPLYSKTGRGLDVSAFITYDRSQWALIGDAQSGFTWNWSGMGATLDPTTGTTGKSSSVSHTGCPGGQGNGNQYYDAFSYADPTGTPHSFSFEVSPGGCSYGSHTGPLTGLALDGSGLSMTIAFTTTNTSVSLTSTTVNYPNGTVYYYSGNATAISTLTDRNGNQVTVKPSSNSSQCYNGATSCYLVIDTQGQQAITWNIGGASNNYNIASVTYINPQNNPVSVNLGYTGYLFSTDFSCQYQYYPGSMYTIHEGTSPGSQQYPIYTLTSVTYPDLTQYQIHYEPSTNGTYTGRPSSITTPTGAVISYAYPGNNKGIDCYDGSNLELTRTTTDGAVQYVRSFAQPPPSPYSSTITTITGPAPAGNQTVMAFADQWHETDRKVYQGAVSPNNLLMHTTTAYSYTGGGSSPTSITSTVQFGNLGASRRVQSYAPNYNLLTEDDEYDFDGTLLKKTLISYASLGNNIFDRPATVTVQNSVGTTVSQTSYNYDETGTSASGAPQLIPVSGSRGNATTISNNGLVSKNTYFDTGNVYVATDVNNAQTTYTYGSCGNSFPTSIAAPLGLTTTRVWNCTGGVMTSETDPNLQARSWTYNDPYFWRVNQKQDEMGSIQYMTYSSPIQSSGSMTFNGGNSINNVVAILDSLSRSHLIQNQQAPGSTNYDTTETDYSWASTGRQVKKSLPFSASLGGTNPSGPGITTVYDALGRTTQIQNPGSTGYISYSYSGQDVLQTIGPATPGENLKKSQLEYDALGRLTSVCELTAASGSQTCGQSTTQTGFWTRYRYDAAGRLTGVCQNTTVPLGTDCVQSPSAGQQTRAYSYDGLGRLTSETNPESGTEAYIWDSTSASSCGIAQTFSGDLVRTVDANGTDTCFYYDALHRLTDVGTNRPGTDGCRRFRYDGTHGVTGTIPTGVSVANTMGRLAEAETDSCSPFPPTSATITTDEWFSYDKDGRTTNFYESTPHSSGYYAITASYWANGLLDTLKGVSLPTITYGPDGEGRPSTVSASAGVSPIPVSSPTLYNAAGQVTDVTFGSGDLVHFIFDPNTGSMNQYNLTINGTATYGNLTWNPNGTLGHLAITDPFNSSDAQTCNYGHDDLLRVASVDCGASIWKQNFTYDAFGNLTKTVPTGSTGLSFQPGYNPNNNHYTDGATYDAAGNLTNDGTDHVYTWDAYGEPVTLDSENLVYDAFGREVEVFKSGAYTEFVFGPTGKLALMTGQTQNKAFVPLPGGTQVKYAGNAISTYRLPDWLGSFRVGSNPNRTYSWGVAFAPFGEMYAQSGTPGWSFTGEQGTADTVSDEYDFLARKLHSAQGRWISPDPAGLVAVDFSNPQTLNRYAYVGNSPLNSTDPLGLASRIGDGWESWGAYCTGSTCYYGDGSAGCRNVSLDGGLTICTTLVGSVIDWSKIDVRAYGCRGDCGWFVVGNAASLAPNLGANLAANNCSSPNFAQKAVIKALTYVAQKTGKTVGFGAGGSTGLGFGKVFGAYVTGSRQIVADPKGNAYFVSSFGGTYPLGPNWFTPVTKGAGAIFGLQVSASNSAPTSGPSLDASAGGGEELGVGVDGSVSLVDGSGQLTFTGGVAAGGFGGAGAVTSTTAVPVCR